MLSRLSWRYACGRLPVSAETMAVVMVTPADGPSLGTAPSGTWIWKFSLSKSTSVMPKASAFERTISRARMADSFMTSPRFPVSVILPLPLLAAHSTKRISPPTAVQARPVTTPAGRSSCQMSWSNFSLPRSRLTSAGRRAGLGFSPLPRREPLCGRGGRAPCRGFGHRFRECISR